jgi:hypothetical protein
LGAVTWAQPHIWHTATKAASRNIFFFIGM